MHYIADSESIHKILEQNNAVDPEFLLVSANPRYKVDTGQQSCYGDQLMVFMDSLASHGGRLPLEYELIDYLLLRTSSKLLLY